MVGHWLCRPEGAEKEIIQPLSVMCSADKVGNKLLVIHEQQMLNRILALLKSSNNFVRALFDAVSMHKTLEATLNCINDVNAYLYIWWLPPACPCLEYPVYICRCDTNLCQLCAQALPKLMYMLLNSVPKLPSSPGEPWGLNLTLLQHHHRSQPPKHNQNF